MSPILQAFVRVAIRILLGLLLLGQMAFVVSSNLPHVGYIGFLIFRWVFLRVLLQDLHDLSTTVWTISKTQGTTRRSPRKYVLSNWREEIEIHLSWPILSPEPSDFDQPDS